LRLKDAVMLTRTGHARTRTRTRTKTSRTDLQWRTEGEVRGLELPIDVAKIFVGILITQNASKYSIFNQKH